MRSKRSSTSPESTSSALETLAWGLSDELQALRFGPPVQVVLDPTVYARTLHQAFLRQMGEAPGRVLLLGMNPGPHGMAQTGVPFGDPTVVREWLGLRGEVRAPAMGHPRRPVVGLHSTRSEVSGVRLWGWARERFGTPAVFFRHYAVLNLVPLCFLGPSGANLTPDRLPPSERGPLLQACDRWLARVLELLRPRLALGVGGFAEKRLRSVGEGLESAPPVARVLHPSPASPAANRGWQEAFEAELLGCGAPLRP